MSAVVSRAVVVLGVMLALAIGVPAASARGFESLTLDVSFSVTGEIAVTTTDGATVGTTSGTPSVIPAGFYTLALSQPGCSELPFFELRGPGVNIMDNMLGGEVTRETDDVDFLPNSTYTWVDAADPADVYTFTTTPNIVGTPPPPVPAAAASAALSSLASSGNSSGNTVSNVGIVGSSASVPFRGSLNALVSAAGALQLISRGKAVTSLLAGRYTITVIDHSRTTGLSVRPAKSTSSAVAVAAFVGTRSVSLDLSAGRWLFLTTPAKKQQLVVVK